MPIADPLVDPETTPEQPPRVGDLVLVRSRQWLVEEVAIRRRAVRRKSRSLARTTTPRAKRSPCSGIASWIANLEQQAEPILELRLPLFEHGRRRGHHDAFRLAAQQQFAGDEAGFA